jgi:myo-inositol-1-phosphate synthase
MDPFNGLLQPSNPSVVQYDPNPFEKYIQGYDVVGEYELDNNKVNMKILQEIANRMDESKILDSSLMTQDNDIIEQVIFEDLQDTKSNYMQLDADNFVREANASVQNFNLMRNSIVLDRSITTQDQLVSLISELKQ